MKKNTPSSLQDVRLGLADTGGRIAQDLGFGRVGGQILMYLYLWDGDCALDQLCYELGHSKAAVSVAARQLESLGLVRRVWKQGDRRRYYRSADNIGVALRQGLIDLVRRKLDLVGAELDRAEDVLATAAEADPHDTLFLKARVKRANVLRSRAGKALDSPLVSLLTRK